jgi:hypothetical protein
MQTQAATSQRFISTRGYRAEVIYLGEDRVIYHAWDKDGEKLQHNGCRSAADFHREWRAA